MRFLLVFGLLAALGVPCVSHAAPSEAAETLSIDGRWTRIPPPSALWGHAAVHDSRRDRMLVIGGEDGSGRLITWERPLGPAGAWRRLSVGGVVLSERVWHGAVYDSLEDRVIIFGGDCTQGLTNEVAVLSLAGAPTWSMLTPAGTPPVARSGHAVTLDTVGRRLIVFGGETASTLASDVWALNLSGSPAWTNMTPGSSGPGGRKYVDAIHDPVRQRLILFGGSLTQNDVWALSLTGPPTWSAIVPPGTKPPARLGPRAVYDPTDDRMIIFGGGEGFWATHNDLWALNLAGTTPWLEITPTGVLPSAREFHTMVLDTTRRQLVLFGGYGEDYTEYDAWTLPLANPTNWTELPYGGPSDGRALAAAAYDPIHNRGIVFGGSGLTGLSNDCWQLALSSNEPEWSEVAIVGTLPSPRLGSSLVHDLDEDRLILFGGSTGGAYHNDTWVLDNSDTSWSLVATTGGPPAARWAHTGVYDPARRRMVVFGGSRQNSGTLSDVWTLSLTGPPTWTQMSPAGPPPPSRGGHSVIMDSARDRIVIFGGGGGLSAATYHYNDVWELSFAGGGTWRQIHPTGTLPAVRRFHVAGFDAARNRMIVTGGGEVDVFWQYYRDTWALSLDVPESWTQLFPDGDLPPSDYGRVGFFDPIHDRLVSYGGSETLTPTLELTWYSPSSVAAPDVRPPVLVLHPARPNPMRDGVRISFTSAEGSGPIRLDILDVSGRRVRSLLAGAVTPGEHEVSWDGRDDQGTAVAAGAYFYRLSVDDQVVSKKLIRVR